MMHILPTEESLEKLKSSVNGLVTLPDETWDVFSGLFHKVRLKKGDHYIQTGVVQTKLGFLIEGLTRTFYSNSSGKEFTKKIHSPGSFIGSYGSMTNRTINQVQVQALTDCVLLETDFIQIENLFETHPKIERLARKVAERQYAEKEKRELELAMLSAEERYEIFRKEFPGLENLVPQYYIASYLGVSPTQLSRIRAKR